MLYETLEEYDPEVNTIIEKETYRQFSGLELIASEVSSTTQKRHVLTSSEPYLARRHAGQRFHPHQQVL